jgi:DNA-binding transcriptional MerR regulator
MKDGMNEELFPWETEPADVGGTTGGDEAAAAEADAADGAPTDAADPARAEGGADGSRESGGTPDAASVATTGGSDDASPAKPEAGQADELFEAARARADLTFAPLPTPEESAPSASAPPPRDRRIAPREYYSISEVCEITGLKQHVLRYWESQFALLNPAKNRSGNRVYQRKEIRLILLVKKLLYEEKYTIEGAKAKLEQLRGGGELADATSHALDRHMLQMLRGELRRLAELLTPPAAS